MRRRLPEPEWVTVGGQARFAERLDLPERADRDGAELAAEIAAAASPCMLTGGEPTLRADLPALLTAGAIGMRTDGLLLAKPQALAALRRAGLKRVRIRIHSSRPDAHDWLSGAAGSLKRALRGLQACVRSGVVVEVEVVLTRATIAHLDETVALVCRLGARGVLLRRLTAQGPCASDFVALSPRLGLLESPLADALAAADAAGVPAWIEGVPVCMSPAERLHARPAERAPGCVDCPPRCPGYPADYAERFGSAELWRVAGQPQQAKIRVVVSPDEPTRDVRRRLVAAAMCQPTTLRVIGVARHPARSDLLRELLRLSVPQVELAGLLHGLTDLSRADQIRLRGFARLDAALLGASPEAHDAAVGEAGAWSALEDLHGVARYAVVRSADEARAHVDAGRTHFRLADSGGALASLAGIPALSALVPPCLGGEGSSPLVGEEFHGSTAAGRAGSPHDRIGMFQPCLHASECASSSRCPGLAAGWDTAGVRPQ